jgi:hypothetical protein
MHILTRPLSSFVTLYTIRFCPSQVHVYASEALQPEACDARITGHCAPRTMRQQSNQGAAGSGLLGGACGQARMLGRKCRRRKRRGEARRRRRLVGLTQRGGGVGGVGGVGAHGSAEPLHARKRESLPRALGAVHPLLPARACVALAAAPACGATARGPSAARLARRRCQQEHSLGQRCRRGGTGVGGTTGQARPTAGTPTGSAAHRR